MFGVSDVVDLYYYANHDQISQITGVIETVDSHGVTITPTNLPDASRQWFSFRALQRMILRSSAPSPATTYGVSVG